MKHRLYAGRHQLQQHWPVVGMLEQKLLEGTVVHSSSHTAPAPASRILLYNVRTIPA